MSDIGLVFETKTGLAKEKVSKITQGKQVYRTN